MRRFWREPQPRSMFRGGELPRIMGGILMLLILYMLYGWMRDVNTWRCLAKSDEETAAANPSGAEPSEPTTPLPEATGPTDEDQDQVEEAGNEFQVLVDGGLGLQREEMEPYDRVVEWVKNQSFDRLYRRAKKDLWYSDLCSTPDRYRGAILALDLEVRRAKSIDENRYGVKLHEAWALTDESRGRLYDVVVLDYPKEMPVGYKVYAKAKFAGYFLKLQGYESGGAKPGQAPDKAPLLIGRLKWEPMAVAAPPMDTKQEWMWGLALLAIIGGAFGVRYVYYKWIRKKPESRPEIASATPGEVIPIDAWLERSAFNADVSGNDDDEDDDYDDGDRRPGGHNGHGPLRFSPRLDGEGKEDRS